MSIRLLACVLVLGALVLVVSRPGSGADPERKVGRQVEGFSLKDPRDGRTVSLADFRDRKAVVVVFVGTECPVNNLFVPVLAELARDYGKRGVAFVGVNANRQDTPDRVAAHARKNQVP